ncbi:MAG: hypothetical protein GX774_22270 [Armatimonadetes bacterium]|nr:hypothetical protein [Armatimonadota bacterium]
MRSRVQLGMALAVAMAGVAVETLAAEAPGWRALVSPSGSIALEHQGRPLGALEPGLFEVEWRHAALAPATASALPADGVQRGQIRCPGGAQVTTELRTTAVPGGLRLAYRLVPQEAVRLNSLHVNLSLPASELRGGRYVVDGEAGSFPAERGPAHLRLQPMRALTLVPPGGTPLRFAFAEATPVLIQDDRQWGPSFSIRIGPQSDGTTPWPAGKALDLEFTLTAEGGLAVEYDAPVTLEAGPEWLPLDLELEIAPGSALDFSQLVPWHAPAGKLGRVVPGPGGTFAFAQEPRKPVRFYGVNFCFSALYLPHEQADRLAERLWRLGYNAVRIHHYEGELVDRSSGTSTRLKPEALDQLDYLVAALKQRGLYVTTDLYVSRPVFAHEVWEGATGDVPMDDFKMAVPVNERAWANFAQFTRALLDHVNPYTGLRWAEEPALAWLSLINEGNPGNFLGRLQGRLGEDWTRAWNRWLTERYPDPEARARALGIAPGQQLSEPIPLPPRLDDSPSGLLLSVFLAETERRFVERTRRLLRDELRCPALLTDCNAWTNPLQLQAIRPAFDYVDDHFYVDHPEFIENPWQLPSRCPNSSPVAAGAPGGRPCAFTRLLDRPYTLSEYNYSGPGRFRGVGGILTGALGAVQDWSVIWRFAYSHDRRNLFQPGTAGYFDLASDPLNQAAERASLCLFRRGDMRPAPHAVAICLDGDALLRSPQSARGVAPDWSGLALVTRVGTLVAPGSGAPSVRLLAGAAPAGATLPDIDPYAPEAGRQILAALRRRGWLKPDNPTDLATHFQSETGELTVNGPADVLVLDTERTAGGYAPAGKRIEARAVTVAVEETDATVWVSSLDDAPIPRSRRLLITHLTDLQNTGVRYADKARRVLLEWGRLPHLVRAGRTTVRLRLRDAGRARVWSLSTGGRRTGTVPARVEDGSLVIPLQVDADGKARMLYEVTVGE